MSPLHLQLRDQTPVLVRSLTPEDRPALAEAYRRLTPESRYHRFWTRTGEVVGDRMLNRVLAQNPTDHQTWAILDPSRSFPPIGGASWWRESGCPTTAEISSIVLDGDHGRGVGTLLLAVLWLTAFRANITDFVAYTHPENRRAARWMRHCGGQGEWDGYKLIYRWNLYDLEALPETPAAADLADWLATLAPHFLD